MKYWFILVILESFLQAIISSNKPSEEVFVNHIKRMSLGNFPEVSVIVVLRDELTLIAHDKDWYKFIPWSVPR